MPHQFPIVPLCYIKKKIKIKMLETSVHVRAPTFEDEKKKKRLFCILEHYFLYFTNLFYNSPYILVFIFTYNSIK